MCASVSGLIYAIETVEQGLRSELEPLETKLIFAATDVHDTTYTIISIDNDDEICIHQWLQEIFDLSNCFKG